MKKLFVFLFIVFCVLASVQAQQLKYVFYFIGDGMGVNQVLGTEMYRAELKGEIGVDRLLFTGFPVASVASTFSATSGVTDSAAAGTALATGHKTMNGAIGVLKDGQTPVESVAVWARNNGYKVGIGTSVGINHATPAAFYGHQPSRSMYYQLGYDLAASGFDFFGGADFLDPDNKKVTDHPSPSLYEVAQQAGYTISYGYKDYQKKARKADKMILFQPKDVADPTSLPYAIDRTAKDLTLPEITRAGIHFLTRNNDKGFFFMVEGGKIDYACHDNDAATAFRETEDFDNAIRVAYEFYEQHPDETLIVITADHETGGIGLGNGQYALNLQTLKYQKCSAGRYTAAIKDIRKRYNNQVPWEAIRQSLTDCFGFWNTVSLSERQEQQLKQVYEKSFCGEAVELEKSLYQENEPLAGTARRIINQIAMVGWISGTHTAGFVPVYAIGNGSELFNARMDNTDIPKKIAQAAGY